MVVNARLGAGLLWIQAVFLMNNVPVERVLYVGFAILRAAVELDLVALIVGEHRLPRPRVEIALAQLNNETEIAQSGGLRSSATRQWGFRPLSPME